MNKKAAALLIGLIIIAVGGTTALIATKAVISGTYSASRISDSMIAEEASQAGLEYGLYQCKSADVNTIPPGGTISSSFDLETDVPHRHAEVSGQYHDDIIRYPDAFDPTTGYQRTCQIQSVGSYVKTYKKHTLSDIQFTFDQ